MKLFVCLLSFFQITSGIFQFRNNKWGKIGIGKIPSELMNITDNVSKDYIEYIPNINATTYHTYYTELPQHLKNKFDTIQYDSFWEDVCDKSTKCIYKNVIEMNEIYYSNPSPNFEKKNLYGAAANLIPHRDCILFYFPYIRFYRILIGTTEHNYDTFTHFVDLGVEHNINQGDYIIFDFDRSIHQVRKKGQQKTPRILLKIHLVVCENCPFSMEYLNFVSRFYIYYYYIARYTEQVGTDPTTLMGFFFGILWEYPFHRNFKYFMVIFSLTSFLLYKQRKIKEMMFLTLAVYILFIWTVLYHWIRYIILLQKHFLFLHRNRFFV